MSKVTVVIPAYNAEATIERAILSVEAQTYKDWQLIVVDDGSTDNTSAISKRAGFMTIKLPKRGERARARNVGIHMGHDSKYIAFLDADDWWAPAKLERQVRCLEANPLTALCYTGVNGRLARHKGWVLPQLIRGNFIACSSVMVRTHMLNTIMGGPEFDTNPAIIGSEDWDLWLRLAKWYPVCCVAEPLTNYQLSNHRHVRSAMAVVRKHLGDPMSRYRYQISRPHAITRALLTNLI